MPPHEDSTDPLMNEFVVLKLIEPLDVAPAVHHLSRMTDSSIVVNSAALVELSCCPSNIGSIRGIIGDAYGTSVLTYMSRQYSSNPGITHIDYLVGAIEIGAKTVGLLETLHNAGFLHNNISPDNVAFRTTQNEWIYMASRQVPDLVLTNFESATPSVGVDNIRLDASVDSTYHSPWVLSGHVARPRDDVYRAVELVARLLTGIRFEGFSTIASLAQYKAIAKLFSSRFVCEAYFPAVEVTAFQACSRAMLRMQSVLEEVRRRQSNPIYTTIKWLMDEAILELTDAAEMHPVAEAEAVVVGAAVLAQVAVLEE